MTAPKRYTPRRTWRTVGRGLWAVVVLFTSALDHYATALAGVPPLAWCTRQVAAVVRNAYWQGRYGPLSTCTDLDVVVLDVEVIDNPTTDQRSPHRKDTGI